MDLQLEPMGPGDLPTLMQLWELYIYDLSDLMPIDVRPDGCFGSPPKLGEYWRDERRLPFFIKVDGEIAGFVLIHRRSEHFGGGEDATTLSEFFVMKKYRRKGVGTRAATFAFDMFPGRWELHEFPTNVAAQTFWRTIIGRYSNNSFEEHTWNDRPVQVFSSNATG